MDLADTQRQLRIALPAGGFNVTFTGANEGRIYVLWEEPAIAAALDSRNSDSCPAAALTFTDPRPRCLFVAFKL